MNRLIPALVLAAVMLCWVVFIVVFAVHKKPSSGPTQKRDSKSIIGLALQGAAYVTVWIVRRKFFSSIVPLGPAAETVLAVVTVALAVASVWFCAAAVKALGKQWSLEARVVKDHRLVTEGPYRLVRNPIYTGMLGMLLATGLAVSHGIGLITGLIVYLLGTNIRVHSEERLLREAFGREWDEYARRVPAVIPFLASARR